MDAAKRFILCNCVLLILFSFLFCGCSAMVCICIKVFKYLLFVLMSKINLWSSYNWIAISQACKICMYHLYIFTVIISMFRNIDY